MKFVCLLFLGAGLLPSHTFQHPQTKGKEALPPEQPKKHLRLFGTDVYVDQPLEATHSGDIISSARPVSEFQCDPRTRQGLSPDHSWNGYGVSGLGHSHRYQSSSTLEDPRREQGTSSSMRPPASGSHVAKQTSSVLPEQSSFMLDARRVAPLQPLKQQKSKKRTYKKKRKAEMEAEGTCQDEMERKEATRDGLKMTMLNFEDLKLKRPNGQELITLFKQASSGQYGTVRIGANKSVRQGLYEVPLPHPEWTEESRKIFNDRALSQLRERVEKDGLDLMKIDNQYGKWSNGVRQKARDIQRKWLMTTQEYRGEAGEDRNGDFTEGVPPEQSSEKMKSKSTDQQGALSLLSIIESDRFIPPPQNTGARVYRTNSKYDFGTVGENFEYEGFSHPFVNGESKKARLAKTLELKKNLQRCNNFNPKKFDRFMKYLHNARRAERRTEGAVEKKPAQEKRSKEKKVKSKKAESKEAKSRSIFDDNAS
ncbi:hypothetical protein FA10DRAFT_294140 [Acaromyces ingoldii]|uniref:Uncharacterized protein n=1 Tax=Acaromyces ingoldii TaxID=215250 RepID=A0A316YPD3_9BASI|nr:hypothetical protein FA10DRAFT_294140 [Acaromyces ingoldii]PWN90518.1 hypothetical protein FA10DRAFT_294140 [Acaromyces ingoldii]